MRLIPLEGLEPKTYPKPSRDAVMLQLGALRFELTAAEAVRLADALVDCAESVRTPQPKGQLRR